MDVANYYANLAVTAPEKETGLKTVRLQAQMVNGGWPTPQENYLFSGCSVSIENQGLLPFPVSAKDSEWVTLDFYIADDNDMNRRLSDLMYIGDVAVKVNLASRERTVCNFSHNDLFNMSRGVTGSRKHVIPGDPFYLYAQVRSESDSQQLAGSFTEQAFIQIPHNAGQGRSLAGRAAATFVAALFFVSKLFFAGPVNIKITG